MSSARPFVTALLAAALLGVAFAPSPAQSLLERPPNVQGTWQGQPGTIYFNFMHRFVSSGPPARKIIQTPTFLLGTGLPAGILLGVNYASNSAVVSQIPNEWELFARYAPVTEESGAPIDVAVQAGFNQAALSWDGQLAVARQLGRVRLLAAGRVFTNAFDAGEARFAWAGGATVRLTEFVALAGDYGALLDRDDALRQPAWSVGLHLGIPFTPHTFSLHASNTRSKTLEGASIGEDRVRYGFEFTVPITLSRYFGAGADQPAAAPAPPETTGVTEVGMTNRLRFVPDTVRIAVGETVRWRNTSDLLHTVTADPAQAVEAASVSLPEGAGTFDSGNLEPGDTFEHTFTVPGTYTYFCTPHELAGMVGWVIVSEHASEEGTR